MKRPRVAVVLFGQPRFVNLPYSSISLKFALKNCDVSFFGHLWFDEENPHFESSSWSGIKKGRLEKNARAYLLKWYRTAEFIFERPEKINLKDVDEEVMDEKRQHDIELAQSLVNTSNVISQITSIHRALEHFQKVSDIRSFDFVILTRFDVVVWRFPNLKNIDKNLLYLSNIHNSFADQLIFGEVNKVMATDAFELVEQGITSLDRPTPENLKSNAFYKKFKPEDVVLLNFEAWPLRSSDPFTSIFRLAKMVLSHKLHTPTYKLRKLWNYLTDRKSEKSGFE